MKVIVAVPLAACACWLGQHHVEYLCTKALRLLFIPLPFLKHRRHRLSKPGFAFQAVSSFCSARIKEFIPFLSPLQAKPDTHPLH